MQRLFVIIPQYQQAMLTVNSVRSLREWHADTGEVVVVDDGSSPAERAALQAAGLPGVCVVAGAHAGVTRAWLRGVAHVEQQVRRWSLVAAADRVVLIFLNNDVVASGPWLHRLAAPLVRDGAAQGVQMTGARWRREPLLRPLGLVPHLLLEGWCFALTLAAWRRHAVDPRFESYYSDTDLQLRLLQAAGPDSPLAQVDLPLHHVGHATARSLPDRHAIWLRDRARFLHKWGVEPKIRIADNSPAAAGTVSDSHR